MWSGTEPAAAMARCGAGPGHRVSPSARCSACSSPWPVKSEMEVSVFLLTFPLHRVYRGDTGSQNYIGFRCTADSTSSAHSVFTTWASSPSITTYPVSPPPPRRSVLFAGPWPGGEESPAGTCFALTLELWWL